MTDNEMIENLKKAREYFAENGGHKGDYADARLEPEDRKVCALGAINMVMHGWPWTDVDHQYISPLNAASRELYGDVEFTVGEATDYTCTVGGIPHVNDYIGFDAVLHVYDHTIKTLENE